MSVFTRCVLGFAGMLAIIAAAQQSRAASEAASHAQDEQAQPRTAVRFAEVKKKAPPPPPRVVAPKVAPKVVAPKAPPRVVAPRPMPKPVPKVALPPKAAPKSVVIPKGPSMPKSGPGPKAVGIPKAGPTTLPTTKFAPAPKTGPIVSPGTKFGPATGPTKTGPITGPGLKTGPLTGPGTKFGPSKAGPIVGPGKRIGPIAGPGMKGPIVGPGPKFGPGAKFGPGKKMGPIGPGTNITLVNRRRIPIYRGGRTIFVGRDIRRIVAVTTLAALAVGAAYYYPYGYVAVARPACYGVTAEGCTLNWQDVPTEEGYMVTQCVQFCPQGYVAPPVPLVEAPPVASLAEPTPPLGPGPAAPMRAAGGPEQAGCNIAIYAQPNFGGVSSETAEDQPQLGQVGWGGEISSIEIRSGTWDFFSEEDFAGDTVRLAAGSYPALPGEWTKRIYSFMCADPAVQ
jgi:Beta/Gamma crystallin